MQTIDLIDETQHEKKGQRKLTTHYLIVSQYYDGFETWYRCDVFSIRNAIAALKHTCEVLNKQWRA